MISVKTDNYGWGIEDSHTDEYIGPAIIEVLNEVRAKTVLDAGCGNGTLAGKLASKGFDVTGVDGDARGIAIARERFPTIQFQVGVFGDSPPRTFDVVCSTEVVEHLYSPHELVRYCHEALNPGGMLIISTPYHGYLKNLALALSGKWDAHLTALWHGGHIKFWSRETLTCLLEDNGFKVERFVGVGRIPLLWKSMILLARKPNSQQAATIAQAVPSHHDDKGRDLSDFTPSSGTERQ